MKNLNTKHHHRPAGHAQLEYIEALVERVGFYKAQPLLTEAVNDGTQPSKSGYVKHLRRRLNVAQASALIDALKAL